MALAHLAFAGRDKGQLYFDADLGAVNRYFQIAVGGETGRVEQGFTMIVDPTYVSPLRGPIPESRMGRIQIGLPEMLFDQENRNVQLKSFRDQDLSGPAVSDVVTPWKGHGADDRLPSITFALEAEAERRGAVMESRPYRFAPDRGMSEAMFFDAILKALPGVLPALGALLGGGEKPASSGGAAGGGSSLDGVLASLGSKEIQELVKKLLGQLATAKSQASHRPLSIAHGASRSYDRPRSQAMVAPLLAAAPALMPLLEKVLTPDTIKAILGAADPTKILGAVTGGLKDLANVGIDNQKVILDHLRAVHPSLEDKELMGLLASMSLPKHASEPREKYRRTDKVKIELVGAEPISVDGQLRVLYQLGKTIRFPFAVTTPKAIDSATIEVTLRRLDTREVVARKRATVKITGSGPVTKVPSFDATALEHVPSGTDCALSIVMTWKTSSGQSVGTSITQWITLVRGSVITDVRRTGDAKPLDDVTRYREFWHKVWEGPFDEARRRFELQIKYCYCFEPGARENARMETKVLLEEPQGGRSSGKVKTGLLLSAVALNSLLPRTFDKAPLSSADLEGFAGQDAADRFATTARARVVLAGRARGNAAAWVFPEIALHDVKLRVIDKVGDNGQVLSTTERTVSFPLPVSAHFVGTRSGQ